MSNYLGVFIILVTVFIIFFPAEAEAARCKPWDSNSQSYTCPTTYRTGFNCSCFAFVGGEWRMVDCEYDKINYDCTGVKCDTSDNSMYVECDCTWPIMQGKGPQKPPAPCDGRTKVSYVWEEYVNIRGEEGCEFQWCGVNCEPGETPTVAFQEAACPA